MTFAYAAGAASLICDRAPFARCDRRSRNCCCGMGGAIRTPWPKSQPITVSACRSAAFSIPSATAARPMLVDNFRDRQLKQHACRQVDRQMKVEPCFVEGRPAAQRRNERMQGQLRNALVGYTGKETSGKQNPEFRVTDARQCFRAGQT